MNLEDDYERDGLHHCEGCGVELDADDRNPRCDECPATPNTNDSHARNLAAIWVDESARLAPLLAPREAS